MTAYDEFLSFCDSTACRYSKSALLSNYTTFRIGGKADVMIFPDTVEELSSAIKYISENGLRYMTIGKGSNLLFSDEGYKGIIINLVDLDKFEMLDETTIRCQSGASLARLCRFAFDNSLSGLEFAFGIPGSVGGAAFMNAGAYGGEMKNVIVSCEHITADGAIEAFSGDELEYGYRHSVYSDKNFVISSVILKLEKGEQPDIKAQMDVLLSKRKEKQPLEFPSAGSTFKRPEGYFAGALIEQSGLKGFSVGGARVSEKHAGFVINFNNASCKDVLGVIEHCKKTVYENSGVILEPEVIYID